MRELFQSRRRETGSTFAPSHRQSGSSQHQPTSSRDHHEHQRRPRSLHATRRTVDNRSGHSNSRQSTATTMPDHRSVASSRTVPSYAQGTAPTAGSTARLSDDEWSWISEAESNGRSVGAASAYSRRSPVSNNRFVRDGKVIKRIIDELSKAENSVARQEILPAVYTVFNHNDPTKHNAELYYGAIAALSKQLSMTVNHDEIRMICAAMEMSFRGGSKYVKEAYHINGAVMIPLFLRLLDRCEQSRMRYADDIILSISKVFHYISRISELRFTMAREQGMLDCMQRVASTPLNIACRNVRVRIIANLANCEENKVLMFAHMGLLESLLKIAQLDLSDDSREYATTAMMDLASAPANQIPMVREGRFLGALTKMVMEDQNATIRECAITTLQNLAFPKENREQLVHFQQGIVLDALLFILLNEKNVKARRRAGGALTNLAYSQTAEELARHPKLLSTLASVSTTDANEEVKSRACLALTKVATAIDAKSPCWDDILAALVVAAKTSAENNIAGVLRCKARETENRASLARHPNVLNILTELCCDLKSSLKNRENATRAIMHLANENINKKILCTDKVLDALIRGAWCADDNKEALDFDIHESAMRSIARLATEFSNRPIMAKHKGLLVTVAKATEREYKLEEQDMHPGEKQSFFSKALLMSLLVAL